VKVADEVAGSSNAINVVKVTMWLTELRDPKESRPAQAARRAGA
jgi:hypothetical protein